MNFFIRPTYNLDASVLIMLADMLFHTAMVKFRSEFLDLSMRALCGLGGVRTIFFLVRVVR
jgi:hypothetical protein